MSDSATGPGAARDTMIRGAIREWRDSLIDLSGRNRLLNFKPGKSSSIEIVRPDPTEVLCGLNSGQQFRFRSLRPPSADTTDDSEILPVLAVDVPSPGQSTVLPPNVAGLLDCDKIQNDLATALRNLMRRSKSEYLDRGLWVLYLAFGTLTWVDPDHDTYTSPLLLVPVRLESAGPRQMPCLEAMDEDPQINPALTLKLSMFGVTLPTLDDLEGIELTSLLGKVQDAVADQPDWTVHDAVSLSNFSFAKEAMYRDLLENEDLVAEHAAVATLATGGRGETVSDFLFDEIPDERIDEDAAPETTPLVLDGDSSQRAAIAAAVAGQSFVVDGPPGTGKSQTISNMIGALLHAGKSVLFVSEKVAALDVVKNRLTDVGLGAYLLELHSHKATRKAVATALGDALDTVPIPPFPMSPLDRSNARERRKALNAYAEAMNRPRAPLDYSLHKVLEMIANLRDVPAAPATGIAPLDLTVKKLGRVQAAAQTLARAWRPAVEGQSFAWRGVTETGSLDARLYRAIPPSKPWPERCGSTNPLLTPYS